MSHNGLTYGEYDDQPEGGVVKDLSVGKPHKPTLRLGHGVTQKGAMTSYRMESWTSPFPNLLPESIPRYLER